MPKLALTNGNLKWMAERLGCEPEMVGAVTMVECKREPFDPDGFPAILYERHVFYRNIVSKAKRQEWSRLYPHLCYPTGYGKGGYGSYSSQRVKLSQAMKLDPNAAMEGCSWGPFQELGENWESLGFESVGQFVDTMKSGLYGACDIFIRSIKMRGLVTAMRSRDYALIALRYNGKAYKVYQYDTKIEAAYHQLKRNKINWATVTSTPPHQKDQEVWLGSLLPVEFPAIGKEEPLDTMDQGVQEDERGTTGQDSPNPEPTPILDQGDKKEIIAIEKPEPKNFREKMFAKISAVTGGNLGWSGVMAKLGEANALGLPNWFWITTIAIVAVGSTVYIASEFYKHYSDSKRDKEITDTLVTTNSTDENLVMLVDKDKIAEFEKLGAKIIRR